MGIDFSIKCPGVSVVNLNENKVLYCDKFNDGSYKSENYWKRLDIVIEYILDIFDTFKPELVMLENVFMAGKTAKSNMPLIMARGALISKLRERGAKGRGVMPSQARAFLKIKPNTKEDAFEWVKNNFPELFLGTFKEDNDKADAVILGLNAYNAKATEIF
ncbi:MAG: crossover junction endodeoxyribonuclease RuvC [Cetobacterium sp.]|uniref:crossover junction endodeoxyribonuclease RuvC n=1 Tax=Cetobacterium sp. TaxID=2071632 RepID=UPI003F33A676